MKKKALTALAVASALLLTGCSMGGSATVRESSSGESTNLYEQTIKLKDGRTLTCVEMHRNYRGGLSCDWDGAR